MPNDIDHTMTDCLRCRKHFGTLSEAREAYRRMGALSVSDLEAIARRVRVDPVTLRGLTIVSRCASLAIDWLEYHEQPVTYSSLLQLRKEFGTADPVTDVLAWEINEGARTILGDVDWRSGAG